ncbi:hypothetical protein DMH02_004940 [Streptomyces sp. WAC 00631]|uniref:hypothetical protein n=1 Tax=Streptomyces sp. WAC 00631 TaxID=2203201 RepID=UPI0011CFAEB4|nr:hypothetical protein [Streptomyces sp. WAC 00631]MCC5032612.1 hypothetical protein [Streptomyces sp. WAC 00631]
MNATLASIGEALDEADLERSFLRIKKILVHILKEIDPRVQATVTTYFNHTHVPDIAITWPSDLSLGSRYLYMRTAIDPDTLLFDMQYLAPEDRPIMLSLGQFAPSSSVQALEDVALERHALVLDLPALSVLTSYTGGHSADRLTSRAIIEGGQGALDGNGAESLKNELSAGVRGARHGDLAAAGTAIESTSNFFFPPVGQRLVAFMDTLWQGTGRPKMDARIAPSTDSVLDASSLTYLLEGDEIEDVNVWQHAARQVTLPRILQGQSSDTPNFQRLMGQAMDIWHARACAVIHEPIPRFPNSPTHWTVESGVLVLHTPHLRVHVAQRQGDLDVREHAHLPPYESLAERIQTLDITVSGITLINGKDKATYQGRGRSIPPESLIFHLSQTLDPGSVVKDIEARIRLGPLMKFNFSARTATVKSSRTDVLLRDLIETSIRLFADYSAEQIRYGNSNPYFPSIGELDIRTDLSGHPETEG